MIKKVVFSMILLIVILSLSLIYADIQITTPKNNKTSYIIVVGQDSQNLDATSANSLSFALRNQNFNTKIVQDYNYADDNISNVILIGGSCVNKITAKYLELDYPACGYDFTQITKVNSGQFLFKTLPLSNNRILIIIAGFEKFDTFYGSKYFLTQNFSSMEKNIDSVYDSKQE